MNILEKIKAFLVSGESQIVAGVVAIVSLVAIITGSVIDSAKIASIVGYAVSSALFVIWVAETIVRAIDAMKKKDDQ